MTTTTAFSHPSERKRGRLRDTERERESREREENPFAERSLRDVYGNDFPAPRPVHSADGRSVSRSGGSPLDRQWPFVRLPSSFLPSFLLPANRATVSLRPSVRPTVRNSAVHPRHSVRRPLESEYTSSSAVVVVVVVKQAERCAEEGDMRGDDRTNAGGRGRTAAVAAGAGGRTRTDRSRRYDILWMKVDQPSLSLPFLLFSGSGPNFVPLLARQAAGFLPSGLTANTDLPTFRPVRQSRVDPSGYCVQ